MLFSTCRALHDVVHLVKNLPAGLAEGQLSQLLILQAEDFLGCLLVHLQIASESHVTALISTCTAARMTGQKCTWCRAACCHCLRAAGRATRAGSPFHPACAFLRPCAAPRLPACASPRPGWITVNSTHCIHPQHIHESPEPCATQQGLPCRHADPPKPSPLPASPLRASSCLLHASSSVVR